MNAVLRGQEEFVQPHSVEAEQAVLGSILLGAEPPALVAADFYRPDHRLIWAAIEKLKRDGKAPDFVLVFGELERTGNHADAGGLAYLRTLTDNTATAKNVETYAEKVREFAQTRQLLDAGPRIQRDLVNGASPAQVARSLQPMVERIATVENSAHMPTGLPGIDLAEMQPHLSDAYCVKGVFSKNSLVAIVGPPGCGKTFFATDLALHIALGRSWRGRTVAGGLIVYAALEGAASAENRFVAGRAKLGDGGAALRLTPGPVNLLHPADVLRLIEFIRRAETDHGVKVAAVIIDTLARAMPGADENSPEGMGGAVAGADAVRLATGATVFLIHHTGKDESRGARGHSSLKAAIDTEIAIEKTGNVHVATVLKQRDYPSGARYAFTLDVVELGRDAEGDAVTTCVVRESDAAPTERKPPSGKNQTSLLAALQEWRRSHPTAAHISSIEIRELAKAQGIDRKRLAEVFDALSTAGYLSNAVGGFRLSLDDEE